MKKHVNIPVFIPHLGCPNQCVFCNQRAISGVNKFDPESVIEIIESALATVDEHQDAEIAFFGGSFTGIEHGLMIRLLEIANSYVLAGRVTSIRCSTRPDYINSDILAYLKKYNVSVIELGLQSCDDSVLSLTKRGHSFDDEKAACKMIVEGGFTLVGQMMIGLPGSSLESELKTAEFIIRSGAKFVRIYPTVVFKETELCCMAMSGEYTPLDIDSAVSRTASVMRLFMSSGVGIIRVGLCSSENLSSDETYYAGPNHAALGELCENEIYFNLIKDEIRKIDLASAKKIVILTAKGTLSKAIGQKKKNKIKLSIMFPGVSFSFYECGKLKGYEVSAYAEER